MPVVAGHEQSILPHGRREPDRSVGRKPPLQATACRVERVDLAIHRTAEEHHAIGNDHLRRAILLHPPTPRPGGLRSMPQPKRPPQRQLRRQRCCGVSCPARVAKIRGPIGRIDARRKQEYQQRCKQNSIHNLNLLLLLHRVSVQAHRIAGIGVQLDCVIDVADFAPFNVDVANRAEASMLFSHCISTPKAPRARRPLTLPVRHALRREGSR